MIDYLVPEFFLNFDATAKAGVKNPSGGMRTKIRSVQKAMTDLQMITHTRVETLRSRFVLIEPLYFRENLPFAPIEGRDKILENLADYDGVKILFCSEKEFLRWPGSFREGVLDVMHVLTHNCDFQKGLWEGVGVTDSVRLIDPIDTTLFSPSPKKFQASSTGWISSEKNSEFILDLYTWLKDTPLKTLFVGGNKLWGFNRSSDLRLEYAIRAVTDTFVENVPQYVLAKYISQSAFFVGNTIHDTSCGCHAEAVASGCISVCGGHPIYDERPGFFVEAGGKAAYDKLSEITNGFADMPSVDMFDGTRDWAEKNLSPEAFNKQLKSILSKWIKVNHGFVKEGVKDEYSAGEDKSERKSDPETADFGNDEIRAETGDVGNDDPRGNESKSGQPGADVQPESGGQKGDFGFRKFEAERVVPENVESAGGDT